MVSEDDFFELGFDARGILLVGKFDEFFYLSIEPIEIASVSF